jgi:hypothetical protein
MPDPDACPPRLTKLRSFEGKVRTINKADSTIEVQIKEGKGQTYTLKEMGGKEASLLRSLRKGDEVTAKFVESMKMYHLEKAQ